MTNSPKFALALAMLVMVVAGCGPTVTTSLPPPPNPSVEAVGARAYRVLSPSVVRIDAGVHMGTGVVIDSQRILTAGHVVRGAPLIEILVFERDEPIRATLVAIDETLDLALLEVDSLPESARPIALAAEPPSLGAEVWSIGHPDGYEWSITRGLVSRRASDELLVQLPVAPGASGSPVVTIDGPTDEDLRIVGIISHIAQGESELVTLVGAGIIDVALSRLGSGRSTGWTEARPFLETVHNRQPLVHQVAMARRVVSGGEDLLAGVQSVVEVPAFPALVTLELRTTWRYFFTGSHTFRYRVVAVADDGTMETLHEGPLRSFELADERKSYAHKVEIDLELPARGDYAVLVETHDRVSAVQPFSAVEHGDSLDGDPQWPFTGAPIHHVLLAAASIETHDLPDGRVVAPAESAESVALVPTPTEAPPTERADGTDPDDASDGGPGAAPDAKGAGEALVPGSTTDPPGVTVRGSFNTIRMPSFPASVKFQTWTRWAGGMSGDHTFRHEIVTATGSEVDVSPEGRFTMADERAVHDHIEDWDLDLDAPGLYFVLAYTDGAISNVVPIWVESL